MCSRIHHSDLIYGSLSLQFGIYLLGAPKHIRYPYVIKICALFNTRLTIVVGTLETPNTRTHTGADKAQQTKIAIVSVLSL